MQDVLKQKLMDQAAEVNGFRGLLADISVIDWAVTVLIIACAYGLTWTVRSWVRRKDLQRTTPSWININLLGRLLLPFLLWLFADLAQIYAEQYEGSAVWFEFLSQIFGAFLVVRLFLYIVRRALPQDGGVRRVIERSSVVLIWAVMLLNYVGRLDIWWQYLESLKITFGKNSISAANVLALFFVVIIVWLVVKWLSYELEIMLLKRPSRYFIKFDLSARVVLVRIFKGVLITCGVLFSLSAVGLDLTVLSVFGGALGVGIGLGLQKIASNYVSGFVILFERSVRIGDLITTGGFRGNVTEINARYTVVQGTDGNEVLVPNESLVTNPVVNWTLNDKKLWISTSVYLKHGTDIEFIQSKLLAAVKTVPRVLEIPAPNVFLSKIVEKGYVFDITWWIGDPENGRMGIISDVNVAVWRACRDNHIEFMTPEPEKEVVPG